MKREAELKSRFGQELRRQLPGFLILSYATNGAPDREIVGNNISSRWECKHATPDFQSPGDQELLCCRLAAAAHCRYVIWWERGAVQKTLIAHPLAVMRRTNWDLEVEAQCEGFDMRWLVEYVGRTHGIPNKTVGCK